MKITPENTTRKLDTLGRISIPKAMRQRLSVADLSEVEFFTIEDDHGRSYIAMATPREDETKAKCAEAIALLEELGVEIPEALREKE